VAPAATGLTAEPVAGADGWVLRLSTERPALSVQIDCDGDGRPADNGFHLVPGFPREVPLPGCSGRPRGAVGALNHDFLLRF
jgi:beta-mannosidase